MMQIRVDRRTLSIKFIFAISLIYFLDLITIGRLSDVFLLDTSKVTALSEYWRLITYPLAYSNFVSLALFLWTFILFVPLLEKINSKVILSALAITTVVIQSSVLLLAGSFASINPIGGMAGLSWFMLALTIFTYPGSELGIMGKRIKTWLLVLAVMFIYSAISFSTYWSGWTEYPISQHIMMTTGIIFGFVSSFILRYSTKKFFKLSEEVQTKTNSDNFTPAMVETEEEEINKVTNQQTRKLSFSTDFEDNEITLNSILDKINEFGTNSLTEEELQFLRNYKD